MIRRMGFTADVDLQTDSNNQWLTRLWNLTVFNLDLQSEDTLQFSRACQSTSASTATSASTRATACLSSAGTASIASSGTV